MVFEKPKITNDEWTVVLPRRRNSQSRKFPKIKPPTQQQEPTHWTPTDIDTSPERESKLMHKVQICIDKLDKSEFFHAFLDQIKSPETHDYFHTLTEMKPKMVVYGIGSIESFEPPRLQLCLAVLMKRKLDWLGDVEVFDPIISLTESKVLESLGCRVLSVNEHGGRRPTDPTLFFMPHCEAELYENLLKANWGRETLNRIVLIGNSFQKYEEQRSVFRDVEFDESRKHLLAVGGFTKEFEIRTFDDECFRAFQGSSWHFFRVDAETNLQLN